MRLVSVKAPKGNAQKISALAFKAGITEFTQTEPKIVYQNKVEKTLDAFEMETATPKAKKFIESLMASEFYNPNEFKINLRHPEAIFAAEGPKEETKPFVRPTTDVYDELWQFSQITTSLVIRVFLSALLVAYGMREGYMPLIIAGLLFLPYHHNMLGMAVGGSIGEWKLFGQSFLAFLVTTIMITAAGVCIALFMEPGIKFHAFTAPAWTSFALSAIIGAAAGFGSMDDAGRRELIGLAATAHIAVYPVWFGMKFIFGFEASDQPIHSLLIFLMDVTTLSIFAAITYKLMRLKGKGIRSFVSEKRKK